MWYFSLSLLIFCAIVGGREPTRWGKLLNGISNSSQQSFGEYARQKMANLHLLRDKLQKQSRIQEEEEKVDNNSVTSDALKYANSTYHHRPWNKETLASLSDKSVITKSNLNEIKSLSEEKNKQLSDTWDGYSFMLASKQSRDALLSKLIPRTDMLQKLIKIRGKLDPGLRSYLTAKYNSMLTNLIPFSDSIGVPSSVINALKLNENIETRWNLIESLLEKKHVETFLRSLPEFSKMPSVEPLSIQSRADDQDTFVKSDQEPDATSKGHKKYPNLDISHSNRRTRLRKGENVIPDRTGYEQGYDQYGLYGQDTYDSTSYGKGYDDYYSLKSYGSGHAGGGGGAGSSQKAYGGYGDSYSSGTRHRGSYGSAKGHGGGGYGGSGGGAYGSGSGIMDPFSILGGLAFLTYLGLLLQQSLNRNNTGRAFPNYDTYLIGSKNGYRQNIQLTQLPLRESSNKDSRVHARNLRSVKKNTVQNVIHELEYIWNEIEELERIGSLYCRHLKLCQVVEYISNKPHLLDVFKEALEYRREDVAYVEHLISRKMQGSKLLCKYDIMCAG